MKINSRYFYGWVAASGLMAGAQAAEIVSWRKDGNGLYPDAKVALDWSDTAKTAWATATPERGNASPILVDGKLYFTAEPATLVCADATTGEILWQKGNEAMDLIEMTPEKAAEFKEAQAKAAEVAVKTAPLERDLYRAERQMRRDRNNAELRGRVEDLKKQIAELKKDLGPLALGAEKPPAHDVNGYASYTPVSDGKHVWACFGVGVVVCYDLDGKRVWHRKTDAPDHDWGGSTSPTLVDGKLILRFGDYVALDPATGQELWRTPSAGVNFNSPASFELEGKHFLFTSRGELIRAADGKLLSSLGFETPAKPWCFFNTPSVIGNRIYGAHGCEGQQGDAYALEIPSGVTALEKDGLKKLWESKVDQNRYYSSPVVHEGIVYLISREYVLQALDAETGEEFFREKVRGFSGTAYPSLTLVGDKIFIGAEDGNLAFIKPGKSYEEISRSKIEPFRSSPIFAGGRGFLRTQERVIALKPE